MAAVKKAVKKTATARPTVLSPVPRDLERLVRGELRILGDAVLKMQKEFEQFLTRERTAAAKRVAPRARHTTRSAVAARH